MAIRKPYIGNHTKKTTFSKAAKKAEESSQDSPAVRPRKSAKPAAPAKKAGGEGKARKTKKAKITTRRMSATQKAKKTVGKKAATAVPKKTVAPYKGPGIRKVKGAKEVSKAVKGREKVLKRRVSLTTPGYPAMREKPPPSASVPVKRTEGEREPFPVLPREYGENDLLLMAVDPDVVYAAWEIRRDDLPEEEGELTMRISEVSGISTSRARAGKPFLDIRIDRRVGSGFFDIHMPGRDIVAEIGLLFIGGTFRPILRSPVVSFPKLPAFDELGIVRKLFEAGMRVGY